MLSNDKREEIIYSLTQWYREKLRSVADEALLRQYDLWKAYRDSTSGYNNPAPTNTPPGMINPSGDKPGRPL
jgi:hypothetical protein